MTVGMRVAIDRVGFAFRNLCVKPPLEFPPLLKVVGVERFELPTYCSQSNRATRLRYTPLPTCWKARKYRLSADQRQPLFLNIPANICIACLRGHDGAVMTMDIQTVDELNGVIRGGDIREYIIRGCFFCC